MGKLFVYFFEGGQRYGERGTLNAERKIQNKDGWIFSVPIELDSNDP